MSDLRAIAETIKAARDERNALTQRRMKQIAEHRAATRKLLAQFDDEHSRKTKQDAQIRAGELNAIRARANAVQTEAQGLMKTYAQARDQMAQTLAQEAKALRQKLAALNQTRLTAQKILMTHVKNEHKAIQERVRSVALDVERQLKAHEQTRRDGRDAWNRILGKGSAKATMRVAQTAAESPFAINIPFAPPKPRK